MSRMSPINAETAVRLTYIQPEYSSFRRAVIHVAEWLGRKRVLERLYDQWLCDPATLIDPFSCALSKLRVTPMVAPDDLARIPATGGALIVANHPFGILDGVVMGALLRRVRPDVKIMTHSLLSQPAPMHPYMLPVDFSGTPAAKRLTSATRRAAVEWLACGHVVVIFPAGGVSTAPRPWSRRAMDGAWHPFVVRLAQVAGVQVIPVHVAGQNSRLFHLASFLSYPLRVALIFHETRRRIGTSVALRVGTPADLAQAPLPQGVAPGTEAARQAQAGYLRRLCYELGGVAWPDQTFRWPRYIRF